MIGAVRGTSRHIITLVMLTTLTIATVPSPSEAVEDCETITRSVVLTEELLACWGGGIRAALDASEDLIVDLNGLTVEDRFIAPSGSHITVKNGTIDLSGLPEWSYGIDALMAADFTLDNVSVKGSTGVALEAGRRTVVRNSVFRDNRTAIEQWMFGHDMLIEKSSFVDNRVAVLMQGGSGDRIVNNRFRGNGIGVSIPMSDEGPINTYIASNRFHRNGFGVSITQFHLATNTVIEKNIIHASESSGIAIASSVGYFGGIGGAQGTVIRKNLITRSGTNPQNISACRDVRRDCVTMLADDGIAVIAADAALPPTITVEQNRTINNAEHGIFAPGVTDGGKNIAQANGATSECVGVNCRRR